MSSSLINAILPCGRHSDQVRTPNLHDTDHSSKSIYLPEDSFIHTSRSLPCVLASPWLCTPCHLCISAKQYSLFWMQLDYIQGNGKSKQQYILVSSTYYCFLCTEEFRDRNGHQIIWSGFLQTQDHEHSLTKAVVRDNNLVMLLTELYIALTASVMTAQALLSVTNQTKNIHLLLDYFSVTGEGIEKA